MDELTKEEQAYYDSLEIKSRGQELNQIMYVQLLNHCRDNDIKLKYMMGTDHSENELLVRLSCGYIYFDKDDNEQLATFDYTYKKTLD